MPRPNVREKIIDAGLKVLIEKGFNGCGVQDITAAAGVPKGSFYNHFESKEALGGEVVEREDGPIAVHVAAAVTHTMGGLEVDTEARVIGAEGIWAAGVDAGGIASGGYASGLAQALVLGLAAAESMAAS